mmetsp:Transcript_11724/g.27145  ORF Transcript_11724/g.27145 Transcript_11724/m.27145 type:complete len:295 (+) Transcript_11724:1999-2883(+)
MDPLENQDRHENELELPCDEEALQEVLPAAAALVEAIEDDDGDELVCSGQEKYDQILKDFDYQKEEPKLKDQLEKSAERMPTDGSTFGSESVLPAALSHEQRQMLPFLPPMNSETFFASSLFKEIISSKSRVEGLQNVYSESQKLQAQQFHAGGSGQPTADHLKSSFGNVAGFYPWFRQEGEAKDRDKNILSGARSKSTRKFPCRARGIESSHNAKNAFLEVPAGCVHGTIIVCSNSSCVASGRQFRYCSVCDQPVAKRNFMQRHSHGLLRPSQDAPIKDKQQNKSDEEEGTSL